MKKLTLLMLLSLIGASASADIWPETGDHAPALRDIVKLKNSEAQKLGNIMVSEVSGETRSAYYSDGDVMFIMCSGENSKKNRFKEEGTTCSLSFALNLEDIDDSEVGFTSEARSVEIDGKDAHHLGNSMPAKRLGTDQLKAVYVTEDKTVKIECKGPASEEGYFAMGTVCSIAIAE